MREYLIRLIYCEMLGVDCSWGYIHAVKMTQSHSTLEKRIGTRLICVCIYIVYVNYCLVYYTHVMHSQIQSQYMYVHLYMLRHLS